MADPRNWTCPHCSVFQTLTDPKISHHNVMCNITDASDGRLGLQITAKGCANPECGKTSLGAHLRNWTYSEGKVFTGPVVDAYQLRPRGRSIPQPDYIPEALRRDYLEACLISEISPNASAALARRCLQGMILDFAGVKKDILARQIKALRDAVDAKTAPPGVTSQSVDAIDHVREIGNVGAHMETVTGLIVDVDPEEAGALIELIEALFKDWYVEKHSRESRFARLAMMAAGKKAEIASSRAVCTASESPKGTSDIDQIRE